MEQQETFDQVKEILTTSPLLKLPTEEGAFVLSSDASSFAIGACFEQWQDEAG